jgi:hypothetical protein
MTINYKTITLENAKHGVKEYNDGVYGCLKNTAVDQQALAMFAHGLGPTDEEILQQVQFIGWNYGGVRAQPGALKLAPEIARDIFATRGQYVETARLAAPIATRVAPLNTIDVLYRPFMKPFNGCQNWQVWGTKFWHFLNPEAFPIEDRFVRLFFRLTAGNSVMQYRDFLQLFQTFTVSHQSWVPELREIDGGYAWCDNKLWDKMCYGLGTLGELTKA